MKKQLVCCWDCADSFKKEAEAVMSGEELMSSSSAAARLPSWLQQYKDEKRKQLISINQVKFHLFSLFLYLVIYSVLILLYIYDDRSQESDKIKDLCKKWNSICSSVHKKPHFLEKVMNLSSSSSPSSSTSASSSDHNKTKIIQRNLLNWPPNLDRDGEVSKPVKPELLSNPNSSPNSASSSEASEDMKLPHKFEELNPENLSILTAALEKKVPWQKHIVAEIATAILRCRSGRTTSWLSFLGGDDNGKEMMAREMAKVVFGSEGDFASVGMSRFSSSSSSAEEVGSGKKRGREEDGGSVYDRFVESVSDNPRRLFYVEDVDQIGYGCVRGFERVMRDGGVSVGGDFLPLKDAIVVFSCASAAPPSPPVEKEEEPRGPLDLNVATEDGSWIRILDSVDMQVVFRVQVL